MYSSYEEAYKEAKEVKTSGFIYFPKNFSDSLYFFNSEDDESTNYLTDDGFLQVRLDNSFVPKSITLKKEIYETYQRFSKELMSDCSGRNSSAFVPISFEGMYGKITFHIRNTMQITGVIS